MNNKNSYEKLAEHILLLGMGYPSADTLVEILIENFSPLEAEAVMAIPNRMIPLKLVSFTEISQNSKISKKELEQILENLTKRGLLFSGLTGNGEKGYAFQQVGFSFPQTFFWKGEDTPHAKKMAGMVAKYMNRRVTSEIYQEDPKAYRYIPVTGTINPDIQAVLPHHTMESVLQNAQDFAVCHCSCRMIASLRGHACEHSTEICIKFDEVARYVIERGLGKKITREKARELIKEAEDQGLVHFVDNSETGIKHNCNCCGCACWNVGVIKRRKIPRDFIMAVYFVRETDDEECTGCGECAVICPVDAVKIEDDLPVVDTDWCIGCGVCATRCPEDAVKMKPRTDRAGEQPAKHFQDLHHMILKKKGF